MKKYLVVCLAANDWTICDEVGLAHNVGRLWMENVKREAKDDGSFPIEVYELGKRVDVRLKPWAIESITEKEESKLTK